MADRIVFWGVVCACMFLAGYETASSKPPVERVVFLTGKTDPTLCLKGRKAI